tara:strand:+ start:1071 stop:3002 length:1932 start_codon:yes stop_codon:yes gene_type:complete
MTIIKKIISGNFDEYVFDFIAGGEGFEEGKIYIDPLYDIPTVGYGFALSLARAPNMSLRADLDAALVDAGISWTTAQKDFIEDLMGDINAGNVSQAQSDLSTAYDTGQIFHGGEINETEGEDLFDFGLSSVLTTVRSEQDTIDGTTKIGDIFQAFEISHAGSEELAAIYSMIYNLPGLFGAGIADAINNGDRARTWFEMLYNHTNTNVPGLMNRREAEADLFGLTNPSDGMTAEEYAEEVLTQLNTLYNGTSYSGANIYDTIQARDTYKPLEMKIDNEKALVQDFYTGGREIDFIQFADGTWITSGGTITAKSASGKDTTNTDNLIIGGDNGDDIYTMGGDDVLIGAAGNDDLYGGAGEDTFIFDAGDGNDVIYDYNFNEGDVIRFDQITSLNDIVGTEVNNGLMLTVGTDSVFLDGYYANDINKDINENYRIFIENGDTGETHFLEARDNGSSVLFRPDSYGFVEYDQVGNTTTLWDQHGQFLKKWDDNIDLESKDYLTLLADEVSSGSYNYGSYDYSKSDQSWTFDLANDYSGGTATSGGITQIYAYAPTMRGSDNGDTISLLGSGYFTSGFGDDVVEVIGNGTYTYTGGDDQILSAEEYIEGPWAYGSCQTKTAFLRFSQKSYFYPGFDPKIKPATRRPF